MTHKCCVKDCEELVKETRAKGLPLHKFPKDGLLKSKWLLSGGFETDFKPTNSQIVCYKHFKQSDYEIGRSHKLFLKKGSVPSVFADYDGHPDPITLQSSVITSRLQAREVKQSLAQSLTEAEGCANFLDTSCSSLEASMDSSNSLHAGLPRRDCEPGVAANKEASAVEAGEPVKDLPVVEPEAKSAVKPSASAAVAPEQAAAVDEKKDKMNDPKNKMVSRAGLNFLPGSKLEAKDFNEKWYSAKVVETDWFEREVLIHFDKWSSRFDEWIPMDSSRLRQLQVNNREQKLKEFAVGERILATWVDGKKYPAKVNATVGSDKYDVLFDDGYSKILKASKMTKLLDVPATKVEGDDTYVGSKQERRDKKRKHTITELFNSKKKLKNENEKLYKKQDLPSSVRCVTKIEPSSLTKSEVDSGTDTYQNPECAGKIKRIRKDLFKCSNTDSENIVKWVDKNSEEIVSGGLDEDYATYIGELRVEIEDSTYKCPITGCNKNFRKENLLQMHIKYYHPEYARFLGSTPNVADLAYARTIGESVDDVIPKKSRTIMQAAQTMHGTVQSDTDFSHAESDNKLESKHSIENSSNIIEDNSSEQSNSCTMSPGTLFDMRFKEERVHTGIKTLPPVRQAIALGMDNSEQLQYSNVLNDVQKLCTPEKGKVHRKRQHYSDGLGKIKKLKTHEPEENYNNFDNILLNGDDVVDSSYKSNNINQLEAENNGSDLIKSEIIENGEVIKVEKLKKEEIINCTCGITEEDGLMIQCDLCLCWQHGHCNAIEKEKDVPEKYVCYICRNSHRQRDSKKYFHDQDWLREGKLPSVYNYPTDIEKSNERTAMLKRCCDLIAMVLEIKDLLNSMRVKINIAQARDHPKLYLWAKNWSKIQIPNYKTERVPLMEIIKTENSNDTRLDTNIKEEVDFPFTTKSDPDHKLITSDTELMKILEEDSTQADESKSTKMSIGTNFREGGPILLDALTRNGGEDPDQQVPTIKQESNNHDTIKQNSPSRYAASEKSGRSQVSSPTALQSLTPFTPIIPEPEAPIDPVECKLRLLEHLDNLHNYIDSTLDFVEPHMADLEDMIAKEKPKVKVHVQVKQSLHMLIRDLGSIRKLASLC